MPPAPVCSEKPIFEASAAGNRFGSQPGDTPSDGVPGDKGGSGDDFFGIAYALDLHHVINETLVYGNALERVGQQIIGNRYGAGRVAGVRCGVTKGAECRRTMDGVEVAVGVRAGSGNEGHVDFQVSGFQRAVAAAMRTHDDGGVAAILR